MDVDQMLSDLRQEHTIISELITTLERLAGRRGPRKGRPPNWLKQAEEQKSTSVPSR